MSESEPTAAKPDLKATKRWNLVWVIPILAVFIGSWMIWKNISSKGAEIQIHFETADGIIAGKTEIKCRSVTVGRVGSARRRVWPRSGDRTCAHLLWERRESGEG